MTMEQILSLIVMITGIVSSSAALAFTLSRAIHKSEERVVNQVLTLERSHQKSLSDLDHRLVVVETKQTLPCAVQKNG